MIGGATQRCSGLAHQRFASASKQAITSSYTRTHLVVTRADAKPRGKGRKLFETDYEDDYVDISEEWLSSTQSKVTAKEELLPAAKSTLRTPPARPERTPEMDATEPTPVQQMQIIYPKPKVKRRQNPIAITRESLMAISEAEAPANRPPTRRLPAPPGTPRISPGFPRRHSPPPQWGKYPPLTQSWTAKAELSFMELYERILLNCERHSCTVSPLYMLVKMSETADEAACVLDAVRAVRIQYAQQGHFTPYDEDMACYFVQMCGRCDAPDVLVAALENTNELGLQLSMKRICDVLEFWATDLQLDKIEQVLYAMPAGGLELTTRCVYIIIRASVNAGDLRRAEKWMDISKQRKIRINDAIQHLMELGMARVKG